jgi:hypothetical protein
MGWLQPWWGLVGLLALAGPVWLHLRARRARPRSFPGTRFLEPLPRPRARGLRLRDLLLLALRALAVLLAAAALAWPFRRTSLPPPVTLSRVHVLDATLSQQAAEHFERDRARLLAALGESDAGRQDAIVELRGRPRLVLAFGEPLDEGSRRVRALVPSFERGSLLDAVRLAQSLLQQSLGARREIVIYGDRQENQWQEGQHDPPFLQGTTLRLATPFDVAELPNVSVAESSARRVFAGEQTLVDVQVAVRSQRAGPARVSLVAEGRVLLEQDIAFRKPGEQTTLRAHWPADPRQPARGTLRLSADGDALPADDVSVFALPVLRPGRVGLLARSPFLRAALAPDVSRGRWDVSLLDPARIDPAVPTQTLFDVLVLEADFAASERVRELALRHANNGRGLLVLAGRATPPARALLEALGFDLAAREPAQLDERLRAVVFEHALFAPFARGGLGELSEVRIQRALRLVPRQGVTLAFGEAGAGLVFEGLGTTGRVLVLPFALEREATDWPLLPSFLPFLDLALQYVQAASTAQTSATPGALVEHVIPAGVSARELVVSPTTLAGPLPPAHASEVLERVPFDPKGRARFTAPSVPGLYALAYDGLPPENFLAVNVPPEESELRFLAQPPALAAWQAPPRPAPPAQAGLRPEWWAGVQRQRLAWWLWLAAAIALASEMAYLGWRRTA